jgi:UDP-N-acetylglucosamine 1-carboxyvinyltransferase
MIEVGSFIGLAAMTQSEITIKNARVDMLGVIPDKFSQLGIKMEIRGDDIHIPQQDLYEIQTFIDGSVLTIYDAPWPGFTPDLLSIVSLPQHRRGAVFSYTRKCLKADFFVDKLIDMGARIILCDPHRAAVIGRREQKLGHLQ